jgi:hypothetical protein
VTKPLEVNLLDQEPRGDGLSAEYAKLIRSAATGDRQALERLLMSAQEVAYRFSHTVCGGRQPERMLSLGELLPSPEAAHGLKEVADPGGRPDEIAANRALRGRLRKAVQALPPSYRMILFLREMEGLSTREVARVMKKFPSQTSRCGCIVPAFFSGNGWTDERASRLPSSGAVPRASRAAVGISRSRAHTPSTPRNRTALPRLRTLSHDGGEPPTHDRALP